MSHCHKAAQNERRRHPTSVLWLVPMQPNANAFRSWAHTVTATIASTTSSKCTPSDYSVQGSPKAIGQALPHNGTLVVTGLSAVRGGTCL